MKTNLTKEIEKSIILTSKAISLGIYSCLDVEDKVKRLSMRCLSFLKWADIANVCNCSIRYVYKLRILGLQDILKILIKVNLV